LIYFLYQIIAWALFLLVFPFFIIYSLSGPPQEARQRLGFYPSAPKPGNKKKRIWLHAASVGEVRVARALTEEIQRQLPGTQIWVSTLTRHGQQVCREWLPPEVTCIYAPLDLAGISSRAMRTIEPDLYVCLETELWPEIILQADRRGSGPLLLNARLSDRSMRRYQGWPVRYLLGKTLARFKAIAAVSEDDARRYRDLGADPQIVTVCGNAKYDLNLAPERPAAEMAANPGELAAAWRRNLGLTREQPVLVAGSTHAGEEELMLAAWRKLKRNLPGLVLILAPRHLQRLPEVEELLRERSIVFQHLASLDASGPEAEAKAAVLLVDRMGELARLYAVADYVFCGGSLVKRGGHNLLEAAAWGKPVLFGPHMDDFREEAELLRQEGAGFMVRDDEDICQRIMAFHIRPAAYGRAAQQAREIALRLRGAARQQVEIIKQFVGEDG